MNRIRICIGGPGACPEPADSSSLQARPVSAAHRPTGRRQPQIPARSIARQPDPPPHPLAETSALRRLSSVLRSLPLLLLALVLMLPVLAVLGSWLPVGQGDALAGSILREMAATVLPGYLWTTVWLGLLVALGAAIVGTGTAAAVTLFDFRGRRQLEWLLLLPLAMPAYVTAYRSEEHTSELQSPCNFVCRLLLGKKKSILNQC